MTADSPEIHKPQIVLITTSAISLKVFFDGLIRYISTRGFDVHAITSPPRGRQDEIAGSDATIHRIQMYRRLSPIADVIGVIRIVRALSRIRPMIVQTHTAKAGLLGMIAAFVVGVPIRVYTYSGLGMISARGWRRVVLTLADRLACVLATDVIAVSRSLEDAVIEYRICPKNKIRTLGPGSSHGVDVDAFRPNIENKGDARARLNIPASCQLLGFVGRLVRQKGIEELAKCWVVLRERYPDLRLLLCGQFEPHDPVDPSIVALLSSDPRVFMTSASIAEMPSIYSTLDICLLPTYREGLPNVGLECGAMAIPLVATRVPGCLDIVDHGVTGILVESGSVGGLVEAVERLIQEPTLRGQLGDAARKKVLTSYRQEDVFERWVLEYRRLIRERRSRLGEPASAAASEG